MGGGVSLLAATWDGRGIGGRVMRAPRVEGDYAHRRLGCPLLCCVIGLLAPTIDLVARTTLPRDFV